MTELELQALYAAAGDHLPQVRYEFITPDMAAEILRDKNTNNRKIRQERVSQYARDIRRGDWMITSQGIAFDEEENLIDGQHRLSALVKANVGLWMLVVRGVPHRSAAIIDIGQKRTAGQNITLVYGKGANTYLTDASMTGGMRKLILYNDPDRCNNAVSTLDYIVIGTKYADAMKTAYDINHTSLINRVSADVTAANLAALISGEPREAVVAANEVYGRASAKGIDRNKFNIEAALRLRRYMDDMRVSDRRLSRRPMYLVMQRMLYEFIHPDAEEADIASIPETAPYDVAKQVAETLYSTVTVRE